MIHKFFKITLMMIMLLCSVLSVEADDRKALTTKNLKGSFSINYADGNDDHSLALYNNLFYLFTDKDGSSKIYLLNLEKGGDDFWTKLLNGNLNNDDTCPLSYANNVLTVKNSVKAMDGNTYYISGIGAYCFYDLPSDIFPTGVTLDLSQLNSGDVYIDKYAFQQSNQFSKIKFNSPKIHFGEKCFDYKDNDGHNNSITTLDLGNVSYFDYDNKTDENRFDAFSLLNNLENVQVGEKSNFKLNEGALLYKIEKTKNDYLICWISPTSTFDEKSSLVLPDDLESSNFNGSIVEIGKASFKNFIGRRTVLAGEVKDEPIQLTINLDKIKAIDANAFQYANIGNIIFKGSTDKVDISTDVFDGVKNLKYVWLPNSLNSSITNAWFSNCSTLETVRLPEGITSIPEKMFFNCTSLKNIIIPSSVTSIGKNAFAGCTSLTSVVLPKNLNNIDASAFTGCTSLTEVYIPDGSGSSDATNIMTAFNNANTSYSVYTSLSGDNYKNLNPKNSKTVNLLPGSLQLLSYPLPVGLITGENKTLGVGTDLFAYIMTGISKSSGSEYATVDLAHLYGDGVSLKYIPANMPFFVWNHSTENKTVNVYFVPESTKDGEWESGAKGGSSTFAKAYNQLIATPLPTRIDRYSDNVGFTNVNVDGQHYNASPSIDNYLPLNSAGKASDQNSAGNGYTLMGFESTSINKDGHQYQGKFKPFAYKSFSESSTSPSSAKAVLFMKTSDLFGNSGTSGIKGFKFNVIDESELWDNTTGIDDISDNTFKTKTDDAWYSLDGRRVVSPSKGLYIHNGKKIVIR